MVGERGCHAAVRLLGCTLLVVGFLLFIGDRSSDFLTGVRTHARGPATKGGATQGMSPDRAREIQNVMEQAKRGRVTGLLDLFREPALARQREMMVRMLRQYSRGKEDQRVLLGVLLKQLKPVAVPAAIEGLKDEGALSRVRMAELLGELGDARAVEPLIRAMFDPRAADVAAAALDRLEPNWRTSRAADRIVPLLVRVVQTGTVPPDLRNGYYVEMTRTRNRYGRDEPIKSQAPSPEELKRRGIAFRVAAATALFHLRDSRAAEALLAAITRVTYPPRDGAAEKGGKAAYGRRHRETPAPYVRALTACDPEWVKSKAGRSLVDRWIDDLKGNDAAAAGESVIALGFARDGRAVEPLLGYLEHHVEGRSPRSSDVLYERRWQSETVIGSDSWLMDTSGLSPPRGH